MTKQAQNDEAKFKLLKEQLAKVTDELQNELIIRNVSFLLSPMLPSFEELRLELPPQGPERNRGCPLTRTPEGSPESQRTGWPHTEIC